MNKSTMPFVVPYVSKKTMKRALFIIPAGGSGTRFGSALPKQFVSLCGEPLICRTIKAVAPFASGIIVSVSADYLSYAQELFAAYLCDIPIRCIEGGDTRFASVRNALLAASEEELVAVHDAVRPLIAPDVITRLIEAADSQGASVPFLPMRDSIRMRTDHGSQAVERSHYITVQTPQVFRSELLRKAYEQTYTPAFTDDCSVFEAAYPHREIALIEGNEENIKITTPGDALFFTALCQKQ